MASLGITAFYVSGTEFTIPADMTAEFCVYRRVKANCGDDGYAYGCVSTSTYSSDTGKTTVTLSDSVLTANLSTVWFGVVAGGDSGALPDDYILSLFSPDVVGIDGDGNDRGANAICLQTGRTDVANVASGEKSIAIGYDSKADGENSVAVGYKAAAGYWGAPGCVSVGNESLSGQYGVAVGRKTSARYFGCVAIGNEAFAEEEQSIAIGDGSTAKVRCIAIGSQDTTASTYSSVAIGRGAESPGSGAVAIGTKCISTGPHALAVGYKSTSADTSVAIGEEATALAHGDVTIGSNSSTSSIFSTAVGYKAIVTGAYAGSFGPWAKHAIPNSMCISGGILTKKTSNAGPVGDEFLNYTAAEITFMSEVVDLTTITLTTIALPTGGTFYPNEVGVIVVAADTVTAQPTMQFGTDSSNLETLLAATATTGLSAAKDRERFETLLIDSGVATSVTAKNSVAATATTLTGRIYWEGMWVEDE